MADISLGISNFKQISLQVVLIISVIDSALSANEYAFSLLMDDGLLEEAEKIGCYRLLWENLPTAKQPDEDVERLWHEHWAHFMAPNVQLDIEQVKRELYDFWQIMKQAAQVYDAVTCGRITKPNALARAVIGEFEVLFESVQDSGLDNERHRD